MIFGAMISKGPLKTGSLICQHAARTAGASQGLIILGSTKIMGIASARPPILVQDLRTVLEDGQAILAFIAILIQYMEKLTAIERYLHQVVSFYGFKAIVN